MGIFSLANIIIGQILSVSIGPQGEKRAVHV